MVSIISLYILCFHLKIIIPIKRQIICIIKNQLCTTLICNRFILIDQLCLLFPFDAYRTQSRGMNMDSFIFLRIINFVYSVIIGVSPSGFFCFCKSVSFPSSMIRCLVFFFGVLFTHPKTR